MVHDICPFYRGLAALSDLRGGLALGIAPKKVATAPAEAGCGFLWARQRPDGRGLSGRLLLDRWSRVGGNSLSGGPGG